MSRDESRDVWVISPWPIAGTKPMDRVLAFRQPEDDCARYVPLDQLEASEREQYNTQAELETTIRELEAVATERNEARIDASAQAKLAEERLAERNHVTESLAFAEREREELRADWKHEHENAVELTREIHALKRARDEALARAKEADEERYAALREMAKAREKAMETESDAMLHWIILAEEAEVRGGAFKRLFDQRQDAMREIEKQERQIDEATTLLEKGSEAMRAANNRLAEAGELYGIVCFDRDTWKRRAENSEKAGAQLEEHIKTLEAAADALEHRIAALEPLAKAYREIGEKWNSVTEHVKRIIRQRLSGFSVLLDRAAEPAKKEGG